MEENYIHIFSSFLAELLETKKLSLKDTHYLITEFIPVCESVSSREHLIEFVSKYETKYWELKELKKQLLNKSFIFK